MKEDNISRLGDYDAPSCEQQYTHGSCYSSLSKFKSFDQFNTPQTASNFRHLLSCGTIVRMRDDLKTKQNQVKFCSNCNLIVLIGSQSNPNPNQAIFHVVCPIGERRQNLPPLNFSLWTLTIEVKFCMMFYILLKNLSIEKILEKIYM